jgi:hypothetical protein
VGLLLKKDLLILDELGFKRLPVTVLMISLKSSLKGMKRDLLLLLPIKLSNNGEISLMIISWLQPYWNAWCIIPPSSRLVDPVFEGKI